MYSNTYRQAKPQYRNTENINYYTLNFINMNKQFYFSKEYVTPEVEVISTVVEKGFQASFGEEGYAGDGFDIDENGEF